MMPSSAAPPSIEVLWQLQGFEPNESQERAIRHIDGPLYLPAGPGSGKTRVLLWRTVNLIAYHGVPPSHIFLSTFTEKAAYQLREGLQDLLGVVTGYTGTPYDLGRMYIGTVHSLCQRMLTDRHLTASTVLKRRVVLLDELSQYFFMARRRHWEELTTVFERTDQVLHEHINGIFEDASGSRHTAIANLISFCNRLAEENLDPSYVESRIEQLTSERRSQMTELNAVYRGYLDLLARGSVPRTDFSNLQREALHLLEKNPVAAQHFRHVIVDEYQDTNSVQEAIFFALAGLHRNLCVVGDDDQALYRFRGATVENFVQFPERCLSMLDAEPTTIPLVTNYRSRPGIVEFYNDFIESHPGWCVDGVSYRVGKRIQPARQDDGTAVVASTPCAPVTAFSEIAQLVRDLIDQKKVEDPNQIAFLFPSLKSKQVKRAMDALEEHGLRVYAPRAGGFLDVEESRAVFGIFTQIFGRPPRADFHGTDYEQFHKWLDEIAHVGRGLIDADPRLEAFVESRKEHIRKVRTDYDLLLATTRDHGWVLTQPYVPAEMKRALHTTPGLSDRAKRAILSKAFENAVRYRQQRGTAQYTLDYLLKRATSIDWSVLDLFYQLCGFDHFRRMFDLAESGEDEGPICNLSLISQYLARFMDEYVPLLTADQFVEHAFRNLFFGSYLYVLFLRGESEYEDEDDPFPRGRIPFLTIHQSKGLEFPVVVLGNPYKRRNGAQMNEKLVRDVLPRADHAEPIESVSDFDRMRMFYVALSRAKNLLVIAHFRGQGQQMNDEFKQMLNANVTRIPHFDVATVPEASAAEAGATRMYSFTGDLLTYQKCPRQYMIFRKYGFAASRMQTNFFGSLIHRTLEDLHRHLIAERTAQ